MKFIEAKVVDSTHLELSKPISKQQGQIVHVSVADSAGDEDERREWLSTSASNLNRAYGDSEPEYTDSMVKERNPEYGK